MNNRGATTMSGLAIGISIVCVCLSLGAVLYCRQVLDTKIDEVQSQHELASAIRGLTEVVKKR